MRTIEYRVFACLSEHGGYVRYSDFAELAAENEKLRCIISDIKDWDCDVRGGFLSIPVGLRRRMQEALAAPQPAEQQPATEVEALRAKVEDFEVQVADLESRLFSTSQKAEAGQTFQGPQPDAGLDVEAVLRRFLTGDGFIAECDIQHIVAALTAQPAIIGYTCTVPDDCETLHWRGQILSMNELASVAQPAAGEEIMVNTPYDVFTLPLQPSGLSNGPRFVVHVPGPEQPASAAGLEEKAYAGCTIWRGSLRVSVTETEAIEHRKDADEAFCDLVQRALDSLADAWEATQPAKQPAAVDDVVVESIAALLHEETTGDPWAVAGVEHPGPDRDYYRGLARKVAALAVHRKQGGEA